MREWFNVGVLAMTNVASGVAKGFFENAEPILHFCIGLGQFGVAVVTIWYIVKKVRSKKDLK